MRAARIDSNQNDIVAALRAIGCSVAITSAVGKGFPDLVVSRAGKNYLIEIKDPSKPKADRQLTPAQVKFHGEWRGQIAVAETIDEAIKITRA